MAAEPFEGLTTRAHRVLLVNDERGNDAADWILAECVGVKLAFLVLVVVLAGVVSVVVARRRNSAGGRAMPDFVVLEADSPAVSKSGSLTQSIGIGIVDGGFAALLERGSAQPAEVSFTFSTTEDNQEQITLRFYRGNSATISENTFLGEARITGFTLAPAQKPLVRVFVRAADGRLSLAAIDDHTHKPVRLTRIKDAAARALQ